MIEVFFASYLSFSDSEFCLNEPCCHVKQLTVKGTTFIGERKACSSYYITHYVLSFIILWFYESNKPLKAIHWCSAEEQRLPMEKSHKTLPYCFFASLDMN